MLVLYELALEHRHPIEVPGCQGLQTIRVQTRLGGDPDRLPVLGWCPVDQAPEYRSEVEKWTCTCCLGFFEFVLLRWNAHHGAAISCYLLGMRLYPRIPGTLVRSTLS